MRLTLRTLLAWMDGVLTEADAAEMTAKVSATPLAQGLADRIRDVVSRPTLPAAAPDGRGFAADPNSAAEYLDNVLHGERLGDFERICIESDMHLAEVAACHRLLAAVAREPELAAAPAADTARYLDMVRNPGAPRPWAAGDRPAASGMAATARRTAAAPQPGGGARASLASWLLATAALALLVALVVFLGWSVGRGGRRTPADVASAAKAAPPAAAKPVETQPPDSAVREAAPSTEKNATPPANPQPAADAARPPAAAPAPDDPPVQPASQTAAQAVAKPAAAMQVSPEGQPPRAADESKPEQPQPAPAPTPAPSGGEPVTPSGKPSMHPAGSVSVPQGGALAIAAPLKPEGAPDRPPPVDHPASPAATGESAPPADASAATVINADVVLVRRGTGDATRWEPARAQDKIPLPAELLAPAAGRPGLLVDRVRIGLVPQTRATLSRDADGLPRLEIVFGRAVVAGDRVDLRLGIVAGGLAGVASGSPAELLGVEAALPRAAGADPVATTAERQTRLVTAGDGIDWLQTEASGGQRSMPLQGLEPRARIPGGSAVEWRAGVAAAAVVRPLDARPAWLALEPPADRTAQAAARGLSSGLAGGGDVRPQLVGIAEKDVRVENRMAAIATLALLGDYEELVRALVAEEKQPRSLKAGQWTALEGQAVPLALARGATSAAKLTETFAALAPAGTSDLLVRMAQGFDDDALESGGAAQLVEALDSPHLVVRRYAIKNLLEITGADGNARLEYRADGLPEKRKAGAAWWRQQLEQGGIRRRPGAAAEAPGPVR